MPNKYILLVQVGDALRNTSACVYYLRQGTFAELVERLDPRIFSGHIKRYASR
jgi:hypothetical protein